jgi:hypothetical protein
MGNRSSIRIRMSLPSDSVAFSRFNNGRSFSGDPDYDPKAFIRENILPVETKARSVTPPYADYNTYKPYPDSPPPVKVIPDPVRELAEKHIPEPEVPVTVFPPMSPPEARTFFMPVPVPTEVVVEDERPLVEAAPMTPPPMESGAFSLPLPPVPVATIVDESPEVYDILYTEIFDNQINALHYPATPHAVTVPTLEPENPFPDVSGTYTDPIEYGGHPDFSLYEATDNVPYTDTDNPEASIVYFAPDVEHDIQLADINWIVSEEEIPDVSPEPLDISPANIPLVDILQEFDDIEEIPDVSPEPLDILPANIPLVDIPQGFDVNELGDMLFNDELAETSLVYAEPGLDDTVNIIDEAHIISEAENELYEAILQEAQADASLAYSEPEMNGAVNLVDGLWDIESGEERLIKDIEDEEAAETVYPEEFPAEAAADELHDAILHERYPDTSLVYAEPGMSGLIDLVDSLWVLKESEGQEASPEALYPDGFPSEDDRTELYDAILREEDTDTSLVYAEPGMSGSVDLVDSLWVLKESEGQEAPPETHREESSLFSILTEMTVDSVETVEYPVTQSYFLDSILDFNIVLPENEAMARNIYDTIVSIEAAPDRPPEVIIGIGPVSEDKSAGMMPGASLQLIKRLSNGKYYLQIGLFDRTEILARKLTSLDWVYPYALETYGDLQSQKYKLLVGPLNEGESNALLLRFKRGYPDAFIRRDG